MFQNILDEEIEKQEDVNFYENSKKIDFKKLFSLSDIILYIVSFMISMVGFGGEFAPFSIAILAAVCSNKIPAGIVFIATCVGTLIGFGFGGLLTYLVIALLFIALMLIKRPFIDDENRNEKLKLGKYVLICTFVVQAGKMLFGMFLFYDLLTSIMFAILSYIFYKIFVNSITVIRGFGTSSAFTVEEVMGASMLVAIAFYSLNWINVFGLSISNILSIMLVLFLGWKNGILVGASSGITIGTVLGIIGNTNPILLASYTISRNDSRNIK